jgi:hypothetical protein
MHHVVDMNDKGPLGVELECTTCGWSAFAVSRDEATLLLAEHHAESDDQ